MLRVGDVFVPGGFPALKRQERTGVGVLWLKLRHRARLTPRPRTERFEEKHRRKGLRQEEERPTRNPGGPNTTEVDRQPRRQLARESQIVPLHTDPRELGQEQRAIPIRPAVCELDQLPDESSPERCGV